MRTQLTPRDNLYNKWQDPYYIKQPWAGRYLTILVVIFVYYTDVYLENNKSSDKIKNRDEKTR